MGKEATLLYNTLGELIQRYRKLVGWSLSELARQCGIHKGVISKIELGETKRPELKTVLPIAKRLEIPIGEILEYYVAVEQRPEVLLELLKEAISLSNPQLITKVTLRYLQTPYAESYVLIEQLYHFVSSLNDPNMQLFLYELIVKYCRDHGIQPFLAKGLLQKYLIERNDMMRLDKTYAIGEEVQHYVDFLSVEEQMTFYFRMSLHAHNTKRYEPCIEFTKAGLSLKPADSELKARAYLAMINSYFFLQRYDDVEMHLDVFAAFDYDFVRDSVKINRAAAKVKKKEYGTALQMLHQYLWEVGPDNRIHIVNELLEIYLETGEIEPIRELLKQEAEILPGSPQTPYKHLSLGMYYQRKAAYQIKAGLIREGMDSYTKSLLAYGTINAYEEIMKCMKEIFSHFSASPSAIDVEYVNQLNDVFHSLISS